MHHPLPTALPPSPATTAQRLTSWARRAASFSAASSTLRRCRSALSVPRCTARASVASAGGLAPRGPCRAPMREGERLLGRMQGSM